MMDDLRKRVAEKLDLEGADPVWLSLLDEATAAEAMCRQLEALIRSDGLVSTGSKGQARVHSAVSELRLQRAALARLLIQLGVGDAETQSARQTRIARRRWDR